MTNRLLDLGTIVMRLPHRSELPIRVAEIARLWAELHEADAGLAIELAARLPTMKITRATKP